LATGW